MALNLRNPSQRLKAETPPFRTFGVLDLPEPEPELFCNCDMCLGIEPSRYSADIERRQLLTRRPLHLEEIGGWETPQQTWDRVKHSDTCRQLLDRRGAVDVIVNEIDYPEEHHGMNWYHRRDGKFYTFVMSRPILSRAYTLTETHTGVIVEQGTVRSLEW